MWPQITILALCAVSVGNSMSKGSLGVTLLASAINIGLLYAGGFFACFGWTP